MTEETKTDRYAGIDRAPRETKPGENGGSPSVGSPVNA
jgi:hypothetical protein